jgi:hypothetical protein
VTILMAPTGRTFIHRSAMLSVALLVAACDDGTRGELQAKPIYGDMNGLYYGAMCKGGGQAFNDGRTRAIRIMNEKDQCAVLYIDGVDRGGGLMIFPGPTTLSANCGSLVEKLVSHRAHETVLAQVKRACTGTGGG